MNGKARRHRHQASFLAEYGLSTEIVLAVLGSLLLGLVIIVTEASTIPAGGFIGLILLLGLTFYRLDWGFYIFLATVLLCDQFPPPELPTPALTAKIQYFENIKTLKYLPSVAGGVMTPMEVHLLGLIALWFLIGLVKRNLGWNRIAAWGAVLMFGATIVVGLLYGMANGGVFLTALWEIRAMFYAILVYFFASQIIQTRAQVSAIMWVLILTLTIKGMQGTYYYVTVGNFSFDHVTAFTNHEDPIFMLLVFGLMFGLIMFRGHRLQLGIIGLCMIPLIMGFHVAQRRASFAAAGVTIMVILMMLTKQERWKIIKPFIPLVVLFFLYLAVFWNSNSKYGSFAQTIKSGFITDKNHMSREDYYSNLYRDIEKYNLAQTILRVPLMGVGFGRPFDQPVKLYDIGFDLNAYIPHNMLIGLFTKVGMVGYFCFWVFINAMVFMGAATYPGLRDPYLKAVCLIAVAAIFNQIIVSYFDLQLTFSRNMVLLGTMLGLLSQLRSIDLKISSAAPQANAA